MIKHCTCTHAFQDARYGAGMRVHTVSAKGEAHCTVCGGPSRAQARCDQMARDNQRPMVDAVLGNQLCTKNSNTGWVRPY